MNILIINQPPFNRGDESAHKGLIRTLLKRFPDAKIKVMHEAWLSESYRQYAVKDKRVEYFSEVEGCIKFPRFRNHDVYKSYMVVEMASYISPDGEHIQMGRYRSLCSWWYLYGWFSRLESSLPSSIGTIV